MSQYHQHHDENDQDDNDKESGSIIITNHNSNSNIQQQQQQNESISLINNDSPTLQSSDDGGDLNDGDHHQDQMINVLVTSDDDGGIKPTNQLEIEEPLLEQSIERKVSYYMITSHFITRMGDRMWEFIIPLILIYITPNSLLPTSLFGLSVTLIRIILGPTIGDITDKQKKLFVITIGILGQLMSIGLSSFIMYNLLRIQDPNQEIKSNIFYSNTSTILFISLLIMASLHSMSGQIMDISVERKWVPAIIKRQDAMVKCTSTMKQVDLATEVLAPFIAGLLASFYNFQETHQVEQGNVSNPTTVFLIVAIFNFISFIPQYLLLSKVSLIAKSNQFDIDYDLNHHPHHNQMNQKNNQSIIKRILLGEWNPLTNIIKGWSTFRKQEKVVPIVIAYVCLWFTLLSPHDPVLTAYLSSHGGYSYLDLSLFRGLGAFFGLAATFSYQYLRQFKGIQNTAVIYIVEEAVFVLASALLFASIESSQIVKYLFLISIVFSRCGLYGYELFEINYIQSSVDHRVRGIISGVESSLTSLASLIVFLASIIINSPTHFYLLIWLSTSFILLGSLIVIIWRFKQ